MSQNYYMINQQKLLFVVAELHRQGYEHLKVYPSVSPNGMSWRCSIYYHENRDHEEAVISNWLDKFGDIRDKEIELSIFDLSRHFALDFIEIVSKCKGANREYVVWYWSMVHKLRPEELPYAESDYFSSRDYWKTSQGNEINTLRGEELYYPNQNHGRF